jgi:hypothetical protein
MKIINNKLKAFSLQSAIILLLMMSIIISALILGFKLDLQIHNQTLLKSHLISDIESAYVIAMHQKEVFKKDSLNLRQGGKIHYKRKNWGLFDAIFVHGKYKNIYEEKAALLSKSIQLTEYPTIHIYGGHNSLSVCGETYLNGRVYSPNARIQRAYIEGESYHKNKLFHGELKDASTWSKKISKELIEKRFKALGDLVQHAEFVPINILGNDSLMVSFKEEVICIHNKKEMEITNNCIGNVVISSDSLIVVGPDAYIESCILYAPKVILQEGFKGNCQVFARDVIEVEDHVELHFPSVLFAFSMHEEDSAFISIASDCKVEGLIIADKKNIRFAKTLIQIGDNSIVNGIVYSNACVDLKADVNGSIWCQKFMLKTPSSVYENTLLDVNISSEGMPKWFPCCFLEDEKTSIQELVDVR